MDRLENLGLDDKRQTEIDEFLSSADNVGPDLGGGDSGGGDSGDRVAIGRVARVDRGEVWVITNEQDLRVLSDSQRAQSMTAPVTGDWVAVRDDPELGLVVDHVFERHTAIVRRDPAEQITDQVLVSNVDRVAVVHGLDQPLNDARIERFLVLAIDSGAEPLIILTKSDLERGTNDIASLETVAPVVRTSAASGEGIEDLRAAIPPNSTVVFIGPSGVGKSTLVNELAGEQLAVTSEVRAGDRRGRHTTTVRELIELPEGRVVIDTPGIRAVGLWSADIALDEVFADIAELAEVCRFRDCTHRSEPDCAVKGAVDKGAIDSVRLARYQLLWQELAEQAIELERRQRTPRPSRRNKRRR